MWTVTSIGFYKNNLMLATFYWDARTKSWVVYLTYNYAKTCIVHVLKQKNNKVNLKYEKKDKVGS